MFNPSLVEEIVPEVVETLRQMRLEQSRKAYVLTNEEFDFLCNIRSKDDVEVQRLADDILNANARAIEITQRDRK